MQTLSYGYQLPDAGDKGDTLWTALELNITRLNTHNHDGTNSQKLSVSNFTTVKQSLVSSDWATYGGPTGFYRQTVSIPAGFTWDDFIIEFRDASSGEVLKLSSQKIDNTHYYLYITDNTLNVTAVYGV